MYNFFSRHKHLIYKISLAIEFFIIFLLFYFFAPKVFQDSNVFFYTLSTIVQSFIALVAFLGTVVVFKIQVEDQAMQRLSDNVEDSVGNYDGDASIYTPNQMMNACERIINEEKRDFGDKNFIKKYYSKMKETLSSRNRARKQMVDFALASFLNVAAALVAVVFTPIFVKYWFIGGIILTANIVFSTIILVMAMGIVRITLGYDFSTK